MKVYRRPRTWILMAVLVALAATMLIFVHNSNRTPQITGDWQTAVQKQIANDQQRLQRADIDPDRKNELQTEVKIDQYRLDHNEAPTEHSLWGGVLNTV